MSSLVITGPPGSGKTTVSRLVAERSSRGVHLDADHFWHMIVSGQLAPWTPGSAGQNVTVIEAVAAAAVSYALGGYDVVIDGILGPWHLDPLVARHRDASIPLAYVVLYPPIEAALSRARERGENGLGDERPIRHMHEQFARLGALELHVIDNEHLDAMQTADIIVERVTRGRYRLPDGLSGDL